MKQDVKKYTVTLAGERYNIVSDEAEHLIYQAADLVNINVSMLSKDCGGDIKKMWILVALQLAIRIKALESEIAYVEKQHTLIIDLIDHETSNL